MNKSQMLDEIQTFFGKAGMDLQVGSKVIKGKKPKGRKSVTTHDGTKFKVGDVIQMKLAQDKDWGEPEIVTDIFTDDDGAPEVASVRVDDPERVTLWRLPTRLWGPDLGQGGYFDWFRQVKVIGQNDVDLWWHENRTLKPGWHKLQGNRHFRVHIAKDGTPDIIERGHDGCQIDETRRMTEILTGYDLTIETRYCDPKKLQRKVKTAVRRSPPKV
jgi:hypothetical protein